MVSKVIHASGKRKSATARATLKKGNGVVHINNVRIEALNDHLLGMRIGEPLTLIGERAAEFNISVNIKGGGPTGQAEAARLAIARALVVADNKFKKLFESYDRLLLVADVRRKEQRKPGRKSKARAKTQKSYR